MGNVLIDDRRIHVDFSQSVAKVQMQKQGNFFIKSSAFKWNGNTGMWKCNYAILVYFTVQLFNFQEWPKINFSPHLFYAFLSIKEKRRKLKQYQSKVKFVWFGI